MVSEEPCCAAIARAAQTAHANAFMVRSSYTARVSLEEDHVSCHRAHRRDSDDWTGPSRRAAADSAPGASGRAERGAVLSRALRLAAQEAGRRRHGCRAAR